MAGMSGEHRPSARLGHVADQETGPADRSRVFGEPLQIGDEARMSPIAVAREAHDLPIPPAHWKRHGAGETTSRIGADRGGGKRGRGRGGAEERLGGRLRVLASRSKKRSELQQILSLSRGGPAAKTEHYAENPPQAHVRNPLNRVSLDACRLSETLTLGLRDWATRADEGQSCALYCGTCCSPS